MRPRIISALILAALFLGGVGVGMALDRFMHRPPFRRGEFGGPGGGPMAPELRERMAEKISGRLERELDLTPTQRAQIQTMIPRHIAEFDSVRRAVEPQVAAVLQRSWEEVAALLTPEQRTRWQGMRAEGGPPGTRRPGSPGPPPP